MGCNLIVRSLGNNAERAAALWITSGKFKQHHGRVPVRHKVSRLYIQTVQYRAQLLSPLRQPYRLCACLVTTIHNDPARLTQCAYLTRIDKFEVLEYRHKDQWLPLPNINHWHIRRANFFPLPQCFDVGYIGMKCNIVNVFWSSYCTHTLSPVSLKKVNSTKEPVSSI